jgi:hypothetical protein
MSKCLHHSVWNFEFGELEIICNLVLGIWGFQD